MLYLAGSSGQAAPNFWLNPAERRELQRRGADAAVPDGYARRAAEYADHCRLTGTRAAAIAGNLAHVAHGATSARNAEPLQRAAGVRRVREYAGAGPGRRRRRHRQNPGRSTQQACCRAATTLTVRGQVESMNASFTGLGLGMIFAILLVYLLMVVNFQCWLDPFIIITALPGALVRDPRGCFSSRRRRSTCRR